MFRHRYVQAGALFAIAASAALGAGYSSAQNLASVAAPPVQNAAPAAGSQTIDARPWPHDYTVDNTDFVIYRPQYDSWKSNTLQGRAVMSVKTGQAMDKEGKSVDDYTYGVIWFTARTETDKDAREVTLSDITIDRVNFPTAKELEPAYLSVVRRVAPTTTQVASLDQIESALAIAQANQRTDSLPVGNDPPEILFSFMPAVLVLVDGEPQWRPSAVAGVERAVNTRMMLLRYENKYWLGYAGHWANADALDGSWAVATQVPAPLEQVMQQAIAARQQPSNEQVSPNIAESFTNGGFPAVYVRTHPAELITVDGEPEFDAIPGTQLSYVANTPADVFVDAGADNAWYVLLSGRWFTADSNKGPWRYVAPNALPADFPRIPSDSPKSAVLASIAGTPEAQEALVANSIPQTATIDRMQATFQARYDGEPQYKQIPGTSLNYVWNSPTPIIQVTGTSFYALDNGVWFTASAPNGPWEVATSVPAAIYSIPVSSPLHYVTYARVYGTNGNQVYVGYTPGYYGTVVSNGVVVYGTGYPCDPWLGADWYGCPTTYGYGAAFGYGPAIGWGLAFGWGWDDPWYDPWWGPWAGYWPGYYPYAWGGAVAGNVYGRWGRNIVGGTAAAWADPWTGNYGRGFRGGYYNTATGGRGYGYAGRNVNAYTGGATGAAGGIRYNPETGRVVAGNGAAAGNIYSGQGIAGGQRTVVNTNTGRVTNEGGIATRTAGGATAAGGFNTEGARGDAAGGGYVHYNRETGNISHGGVLDVNGNLYAGRDGNVYRHEEGGGWQREIGGNGSTRFMPVERPDAALDQERFARDRGFQRDAFSGRGFEPPGAFRANFDRGAFGGGFRGGMGGFRGGHFGGGFRRR